MTYYSELILLVLLILAGAIGIAGSTSLDLFEGTLPGAGFFPIVLGAALIILVFLELKSFFNIPGKKDVDREKVKKLIRFFTLLTGMMLVGVPLIGLLPSLGLFYFVSLIVWNKYTYPKAIVNTILTLAIVHLFFSVWLGVYMPWGVF